MLRIYRFFHFRFKKITLFDIINTSHSTYVLTLICKLHFVITRNVHILHAQRVHRVMHINETLPILLKVEI